MEKFIHVDRCDSTQDLLKEQLTQANDCEITISCEHQILGKGRGTNLWQDSPGTLCFSMNVSPHVKTTFTALELSTLVSDFFSLKGQVVKLKWPNDLINEQGKKCGGILVQNSGSHYLAGIGLNLFYQQNNFGGVYESDFSIQKQAWVKELSQYIRQNRYQNSEALTERWLEKCSHLNQSVKISEADVETIGTFIGLGPFGEALIENSQGVQHLFNGTLRLV